MDKTQNQSGKQLFEWVKASVTPPPEDGDYSIRSISTSTIDTSWYQRSRNEFTDASILFDDLEWLSPAQPSTGKQLPTDEEIKQHAHSLFPEDPDDDMIERVFQNRLEHGFVKGAKWMRERAQGESDKWIRVEDERKPEPNVYVLVHYYNGYEIAEYRERDNTFRIGYDLVRNVTHWQPLPNAPTNK